ncbi:hypothetical protein EV383_4005 [Pseudonocardia sediminis]|uniref:Uncharacterized protein n=1 Tax=Pseudonocardia sediminis TaxID=1397368 RepID=A0A4Q7V106_PSEST|nr:hypothetical protein [Pseudonocardia sediminis]RZT87098.1 hypothetical protein EV383_4005 [Pseudonocardia sediminis]
MNPHLLQERVASVSETVEGTALSRLAAHKATADACRERARERRGELDRALAGAEDTRSALDLMLELDALERVQDKIDHRLADLCDSLSEPRTQRYGDALPA